MTRPLIGSFDYAIQGLVHVLRTQRNMRLHVLAAALTLIAAAVLGVERFGLVAIVFAIFLVLIMEVLNTAIEATVDIATNTFDPLAKIAKDVAAAAVFLAALNALVIAYLVMFDPLRRIAAEGLKLAKIASADLTVIALGLVLLVVIVLKAASHTGTFLHGGWPSGHAAVSFGAALVLGYVTDNASALVLAMGLAVLVAQSRVEGRIHSIPQVIVGALVGMVVVFAVFQLFFR
ncbi:MAG: phosphatase PAP2 family protein [Coriobacteriia bacterium]|nr:phosphatase PAP2 family protein [Coriobacteriia bacterium]